MQMLIEYYFIFILSHLDLLLYILFISDIPNTSDTNKENLAGDTENRYLVTKIHRLKLPRFVHFKLKYT